MSNVVEVRVDCPFCGSDAIIMVDAIGYANWERGMLIQNALPNLAPSDRERLMTGICDTCWERSL